MKEHNEQGSIQVGQELTSPMPEVYRRVLWFIFGTLCLVGLGGVAIISADAGFFEGVALTLMGLLLITGMLLAIFKLNDVL